MAAAPDPESARTGHRTAVERRSDREVVVMRRFDAPARLVFEAWTRPELFQQWWVPKSTGMALLSCVMDVRPGGRYRLEFAHPRAPQPLAFFGRYLEVTPSSRLVWTNEESADGPVTTVTLEEKDGRTLLVMSELHPTKAALDIAIEGMADGMPESFEQLADFLAAGGGGAGR